VDDKYQWDAVRKCWVKYVSWLDFPTHSGFWTPRHRDTQVVYHQPSHIFIDDSGKAWRLHPYPMGREEMLPDPDWLWSEAVYKEHPQEEPQSV
jgi:hypothetical protein